MNSVIKKIPLLEKIIGKIKSKPLANEQRDDIDSNILLADIRSNDKDIDAIALKRNEL